MIRGWNLLRAYFAAWNRALKEWPEIADRLEESAAERELRRRQRVLDLDQPVKRSQAA